MREDTIYALSTPYGRGGIAIIRISGPRAKDGLLSVFSPKGGMAPRRLCYGRVMLNGEAVDEALGVLLPAPHTYTREDMAELQIHSGPACIDNALFALAETGFLRAAQPGEFTRRAFFNGRLDLSQAEAVMDMIASESKSAAKNSLSQLQGSVSARINPIMDVLTSSLAAIEATVDFPEDDWEQDAAKEGKEGLINAKGMIDGLIGTYKSGRLIKEGVRCAIMGRPNVGKSSFLNAAAGFRRALVTPEAGTTRDVVEQGVSVEGTLMRLFDTAGIREGAEGIERMGMDLGRASVETADVIILVLDSSAPLTKDDFEAAKAIMAEGADNEPATAACVIALNKSDLPQRISEEEAAAAFPFAREIVRCSCVNNQGVIDTLKAAARQAGVSGETEALSSARHYEALQRAKNGLKKAIEAMDDGVPADIAGMDAREAYAALGEITGQTVDGDVIDAIFQKFCVGK